MCSGASGNAQWFTESSSKIFREEALVPAIKGCFSDILASDAELILQIRDDSWGADVFMDLIEQNVPDRAVIKVLQKQKEYKQVQWICSRYILEKKMVLGVGLVEREVERKVQQWLNRHSCSFQKS